MRIQMIQSHDYTPRTGPRATYKFRVAGEQYRDGKVMRTAPGEYTVRREWGDDMIALDVAKEIDSPSRSEAE